MDGQIVFEPLGEAPLDPLLPTRQGVALERHVWAPGAHHEDHDVDEARLLWVETGTLSVAVMSHSTKSAWLLTAPAATTRYRPQEIAPGADLALTVGDVLILPKLTQYEIANEAPRGAGALVAAVFTPGSPSRSTARADPAYPGAGPSHADGMTVQPLTGDRLTTLPAGRASMPLGRMTLAPGAAVALGEVAGSVLLSTEAGALSIETDNAAAWVRHGANGTSNEVATASLSTGDGALLPPGTTATLRYLGDDHLVIRVLTIMPDGEDGTTR